MNKKLLIKSKPTRIDDWVVAGNNAQGNLAQDSSINLDSRQKKRLTIDIPVDLHRRLKSHCASRGILMADKIRDLLEGEFLTTR